MFNIYEEPIFFPYLLCALSFVLSFFIWFTPALLIKNSYSIIKDQKVSWAIAPVASLFLVMLNYYLNFQNVLTIILVYFTIIFCMYKSPLKKSFKWIHISLLSLLVVILSGYFFMNQSLLNISQIFFSVNDISTYDINIKSYLTLYRIHENLSTITFTVAGDNLSVSHEPLYLRIFGVYTALNCCTFLIWTSVYKTILKFHRFKY